MKQVSPAMTIFDKLTATLTAKTRMFDSNFDFQRYSGRHLNITVVHGREHVTRPKPEQRDHPLKLAGFHNQSPLLTMICVRHTSAFLKCNVLVILPRV